MRQENELQRTEDWYKDRIGKVTASGLSDLFSSKLKRESYLMIKTAERYTGLACSDNGTSYAMMHGVVTEPIAKDYICSFFKRRYPDFNIEDVGFIDHATIPYCGASPDGIIRFTDKEGIRHKYLLEIKCPQLKGYVNFLVKGEIKTEYKYQMQLQLMCVPDAEKCLFVNYFDFHHNDSLQKFKAVLVDRDFDMINSIEQEINNFNVDVERMLNVIKNNSHIDF